MRRLVVLAILAAASCRPEPNTAPPVSVRDAKTRSELGTGVHRIIDALRTGAVDDVVEWMAPDLHKQIDGHALAEAGTRLRARFGEPVGILEEQVHHEGALQWYSGLILYGDGEFLTPVLIQFAVDAQSRLSRLLVREHWFIENVENPADHYVPITRFHYPSRGRWYVLHGGRSKATNYHFGLGAQRFAYDLIVKVDGRQRRPGSKRSDNSAYYCHGMDILAPGPGTVVHTVNDVPENVPPHRGTKGGNGLIIDHGFGEYSAIWHAIPGSLRVEVGDHVDPGQVVAKVGNSGRSTGPHIHFHASYRPQGWEEVFGIAADFVDVYVDGRWEEQEMPVRGQYVQRAVEIREATARGPEHFIDL